MINAKIIHYTKLKDRKIKMLNFLSGTNFLYEFITEFDQEEINKENIKLFYNPDNFKFNLKIKPLWDTNIHQFRYLNLPEISVAIKQILAIKKIAESKENFGIVLEDDVIPNTDNIEDEIAKIIKNVPENWDSIFIGEGCGVDFINFKLQDAQKINEHLFKIKHPATNCADAYILKKSAAQKIYNNILPFQLAFDWELAYQFYYLNMNVYWSHPSLFYQGSKTGIYTSSLGN
jgi:GR25 family glycosyltransferase involved in LPS biosynthesis